MARHQVRVRLFRRFRRKIGILDVLPDSRLHACQFLRGKDASFHEGILKAGNGVPLCHGSYFSTGVYRPYYYGYDPYGYYRPYYYRPQVYRSGIRFGYDDGNFRFHFHSGTDTRHRDPPTPNPILQPDHHDIAPLAPAPVEYRNQIRTLPSEHPEIARPHPAFQLRLRDN